MSTKAIAKVLAGKAFSNANVARLIQNLDQEPFPVRVITLPRLIAAKSRAGRPKDRLALPLLIATLDEQMRAKR